MPAPTPVGRRADVQTLQVYYIPPVEGANILAAYMSERNKIRTPIAMELFRQRLRSMDPMAQRQAQLDLMKLQQKDREQGFIDRRHHATRLDKVQDNITKILVELGRGSAESAKAYAELQVKLSLAQELPASKKDDLDRSMDSLYNDLNDALAGNSNALTAIDATMQRMISSLGLSAQQAGAAARTIMSNVEAYVAQRQSAPGAAAVLEQARQSMLKNPLVNDVPSTYGDTSGLLRELEYLEVERDSLKSQTPSQPWDAALFTATREPSQYAPSVTTSTPAAATTQAFEEALPTSRSQATGQDTVRLKPTASKEGAPTRTTLPPPSGLPSQPSSSQPAGGGTFDATGSFPPAHAIAPGLFPAPRITRRLERFGRRADAEQKARFAEQLELEEQRLDKRGSPRDIISIPARRRALRAGLGQEVTPFQTRLASFAEKIGGQVGGKERDRLLKELVAEEVPAPPAPPAVLGEQPPPMTHDELIGPPIPAQPLPMTQEELIGTPDSGLMRPARIEEFLQSPEAQEQLDAILAGESADVAFEQAVPPGWSSIDQAVQTFAPRPVAPPAPPLEAQVPEWQRSPFSAEEEPAIPEEFVGPPAERPPIKVGAGIDAEWIYPDRVPPARYVAPPAPPPEEQIIQLIRRGGASEEVVKQVRQLVAEGRIDQAFAVSEPYLPGE